MPNEAISCPKCGASDVRQAAPDSYVCKHCHANFRWVDPTRTTVAHKPSVCACGRVARAFCVRCREPLCKRHEGGGTDAWVFSLEDLHSPSSRYARYHHEPEWVQQLEEHKVPQNQDAILCEKCGSECDAIIYAIGKSLDSALRTAAEEGRACGECLSQQIQGWCFDCGVGLCSEHAVACKRCHELGCDKHVRSTGAAGMLCRTCSRDEQEKTRKKWWQFWK